MRSLSRLAVSKLAAALMLGTAALAMTATPAFAQRDKKEKAPAAPKRDLSKPFIAAAQPVDKANQAKDFAAMVAALPAAEAAATTPDDKFTAGNFRLGAGIGLNDQKMQRDGLKAMLASGAAAQEDLPKFNYFAGKLAYDAKDYDDALIYLQKAAELGFEGSSSYLLVAEAHFQKAIAMSGGGGQLSPAAKPIAQQGLAPLKKAIELEKAAGRAVPPAWLNRGFSIAYTSGSAEAPQWAVMQVETDPTGNNWRQLLRTFQDRNRSMSAGENLDVMRLMYQTGALQSEYDYAEYADTASKLALFGEVKSVIDQGRSNGKLAPGKLNDFYTQATSKIASDKASLPSAAAESAKAANGRTAAFTAGAYQGYGDYAKAAELYRVALQKGSVDANEVNTRLGIALAMAGDTAGAKTAFEAVSAGPRKEIASFWLLWLSKKAAA
ncbi:hypothetical protein [Sphingobium algorifonticola]|uniref:Tetratricopeptide repeat protein n=1 Tax=Sphingobium algorifonticola TaxID=2008318 RepID=A0A437J7S3_9SPHN|nr:hypothetical protein [Sphingobium algorifonticola]RVT41087.1 hypothetical protein ENE74_11670 [Sphingobium algorifonticola]